MPKTYLYPAGAPRTGPLKYPQNLYGQDGSGDAAYYGGDPNGLFAPSDPNSFRDWLARNLKTPPTSANVSAPAAPVSPGASSDPDAQRTAIALALMQAQARAAAQSPGGGQPGDGSYGYTNLGVAPDNPTVTATPYGDPDTAPAPPAVSNAPPAAAPPGAVPGPNIGQTPSSTPDSVATPADPGAVPGPNIGQTPSSTPDSVQGLDASTLGKGINEALSSLATNSMQGVPGIVVSLAPFGIPVTVPSIQLNQIDPTPPTPQTQMQNTPFADAKQTPTISITPTDPTPPAAKAEKGEPTAEQDAAEMAAANAEAIALGIMGPHGELDQPGVTTTSTSANLAAAPNISNVNNQAPNTSMSFAPAPFGPEGPPMGPPTAPAPPAPPGPPGPPGPAVAPGEKGSPIQGPVSPVSMAPEGWTQAQVDALANQAISVMANLAVAPPTGLNALANQALGLQHGLTATPAPQNVTQTQAELAIAPQMDAMNTVMGYQTDNMNAVEAAIAEAMSNEGITATGPKGDISGISISDIGDIGSTPATDANIAAALSGMSDTEAASAVAASVAADQGDTGDSGEGEGEGGGEGY